VFYAIIAYMNKKSIPDLQGQFASFNASEKSALFKWEDSPFVVSVTVSNTPNGYLCDWWVSGISQAVFHGKDKNGFPKMMLRAQIGVSRKESALQLEAALHELWFAHFKDLAFESAIQGGLVKAEVPSDLETKTLHSELHLEGHDRLGHFDAEDSDSPLMERSAKQYGLLTSMGHPRSQKLIAEYETKQQAIEVLVGAIDRRLYMSRKAGLVEKKSTEPPFFRKESNFIYPGN
jgi:hypothetical protein